MPGLVRSYREGDIKEPEQVKALSAEKGTPLQTSGRGPRIFSVNLGRGTSLGKSWKYRIIGGLVAAAVLAFLLFVALPFLSVVVVVAMIAYLLYSFWG